MTLDASIRLSIEGYDGELRVGSWQGSEPVGELPRYELVAQAVDGTGRSTVLDVEELLGAPATLDLPDQTAERSIHGVVESIEELADTLGGYRVTLVPRAVLLTDIVDHRVLLGKDAIEITRQIFDEQGLDLDVRVSRSLAKRPQTVQAFESSWAFVTRLCAEEGVLWHLEHDTGRDVVVLSSEAAYKPLAGGEALVYSEGAPAGLVGGEAVYALELVHERAVGKITLCDFDFEKADLDLTVSAGDGPLESFEYGAGYTDPGVGRELAAARLGLAQAKAVVLRGRSNSRRLAAGRTMALSGAPRDDLNGRWLIVALEHEGRDHGGSSAADADRPRYEARFVAVPADVAYRPSRGEREARLASLGGVQNATITGPSGQEIHTEEHGRTKALLRWDRRGSSDDHFIAAGPR
jgi:type VI secretion system secreted protein VgrG